MPLIELAEVVSRIEQRSRHHDVLVVAIDGPSGSGKSTLARRLVHCFDRVTLVKVDDFGSWNDPTGRRWWGRFEEQVLGPALAGQPLRYQLRDWENDEFGSGLGGWREEPAQPVVIIEGVGAARATVRDRGAFGIWVEAPSDRRMERGLQRDGVSHRDLWLAWMQVESEHFARDRTKELVDLQVNGDPSELHDPTTQLITLERD